ncbi:hypothetical protein PsorP6_012583 [Peronosclerospora sorghi]|uniref:Uncharacterized protein n=1 Tax=Peronosclerospora sorghi TaxID=230839 RepID=A0ACC0WGW1_9STRA|nr:hypothetical protein PsorP6_012583 [Peronosclerospora sorghi]
MPCNVFTLVASSALLACIDRVSVATEAEVRTVPNTSSVDSVHGNQHRIVVQRQLRARHEPSDAHNDERTFPVPGPIKELAELGESAPTQVSETLTAALAQRYRRLPETYATEQARDRFLDQQTQKLLIEVMKRAQPRLTELQITRLIMGILEQVDHGVLTSALLTLKSSKTVPEELAAEYYQVYLDMLEKEGVNPLEEWVETLTDRFDLDTLFERLRPWNDEEGLRPWNDKEAWKFDVLTLFAEMKGTRKTLLKTLAIKFKGLHNLAPILEAQRKRSVAARDLHQELVDFFCALTLKMKNSMKLHYVFNLLNPESATATRWHFHTLYLFHETAAPAHNLLDFLKDKAGGWDKLAPKLATAKQWDRRAHRLQNDLVLYFEGELYTPRELIDELKLNEVKESELTPSVTDTFKLFVELTNAKKQPDRKLDWEKFLARSRDEYTKEKRLRVTGMER